MVTEDELIERLEQWLATRPAPPTILEVIQTGDGLLFAAFVLKGLRAAAKEAVVARLENERTALHRGSQQDETGAASRLLDGLSAAWELSEAERVALLGLRDAGELQAIRTKPIAALPIEVIERLAILLDIFQAINTLLPVPERADAWLRKPNKADLFKGSSALHVMLAGLDGLRKVRAYLTAQVHGA